MPRCEHTPGSRQIARTGAKHTATSTERGMRAEMPMHACMRTIHAAQEGKKKKKKDGDARKGTHSHRLGRTGRAGALARPMAGKSACFLLAIANLDEPR
jgi:hypothetical protein